ncbi:MAG: hypothetical protein GX591_17570 [Planctomycetes bacterium]|nr:hypothetical protein [Planctomycetota bacterium]
MNEHDRQPTVATVPLSYALAVGLLMAVIIAVLLGMMLSFRQRALRAEELLTEQDTQPNALLEQVVRMARQQYPPATAPAPDGR